MILIIILSLWLILVCGCTAIVTKSNYFDSQAYCNCGYQFYLVLGVEEINSSLDHLRNQANQVFIELEIVFHIIYFL